MTSTPPPLPLGVIRPGRHSIIGSGLAFRPMRNPSDAPPGSIPNGVELDPGRLSPDALRGLVEEYVTREGTDYGPLSWSLEEKVEQVLGQLDRGEARIVFDLELETASLVVSKKPGSGGRT